jgi:hypothetical protein
MKAQSRDTGIALLFLEPHSYKDCGKHHAPAFWPPKQDPGTPCTDDWVGLRTCHSGHGKCHPTELLTPDCPAVATR